MDKRLYHKYDTVSIKEPMTSSLTSTTDVPAQPSPSPDSGSKTKECSGRDCNSDSSYSLPASYVLPIIDENIDFLEDSEFNMLRIVINRIKKVDPELTNIFDISAIIRLQIETSQYTDIINNREMTIKQKIHALEKIMAMELMVNSSDGYKKNPYYETNKSIFEDLIKRFTVSPNPAPVESNTKIT